MVVKVVAWRVVWRVMLVVWRVVMLVVCAEGVRGCEGGQVRGDRAVHGAVFIPGIFHHFHKFTGLQHLT